MVRIEVTAEIAEQILRSGESIEIIDDRGRRIGFFARPVTDEEIAEAKRRSKSDSGGSSLDDAWNRIHERNQTNP